MKVIFLSDVPRVGKKYDVKDVPGGYAENFLIPRKLAEPATPKALAMLEIRKNEILVVKEVQAELLSKNLEEIKGKVVHIEAKADEKGHLFSGIRAEEIVVAMKKEHHADITPEFIVLEKPIKQVGEFDIQISIQGKKSLFKLVISKKE
jgi:large subunit ribosomal protein L9